VPTVGGDFEGCHSGVMIAGAGQHFGVQDPEPVVQSGDFAVVAEAFAG
jgi:hypothetical protein